MLIGLIADTHVRDEVPAIPAEILKAFKGVDLILHAGDIYVPDVLDELEQVAPVLAATGDDDYGEVLGDERVKDKHVLFLEGHTMWLVHCNPFRFSLHPRHQNTPPEELTDSKSPDILVFGHTHYSIVKQYNGVMLVNPGSPFNYSHKLGTIAILNLEPGNARVKMLNLEELGKTDIAN
jgi:uncharacterized protein